MLGVVAAQETINIDPPKHIWIRIHAHLLRYVSGRVHVMLDRHPQLRGRKENP